MEFKITERDKKLLFFLAVFIILVIPLWFVLRPAVSKGKEIKAELVTAEEQKTQMEEEIHKYFDNVNELKKNNAEYQKEAKEVNPVMENNQVDKLITDMVTGCGMKVKSLSITRNADMKAVSPYFNSKMAEEMPDENKGDNSSGENENDRSVYTTTVTLTAEGSSDNMYKLIDNISSKMPAIKAIYYTPAFNKDGSVTLSTGLTVYMVKYN